jgi:hypothetical protein
MVERVFLAHHFWSVFEGTGSTTVGFPALPVGVEAGRRKGSAPLGEAWLFEIAMRNGISLNLRYVYICASSQQLQTSRQTIRVAVLTCHFKHAGLKLGEPLLAPSSVVNIHNTFSSLCLGARWGSSFAGYLRSGKWLNRRSIGAGTEKMLRVAGCWGLRPTRCAECGRPSCGSCGVSRFRDSGEAVGSVDIVHCFGAATIEEACVGGEVR